MHSLTQHSIRCSQIVLFILIWLLADHLVAMTRLNIPAGILGLLLVTGLLMARILPTHFVASGARLMLDEMTLFFIPPVLAITHFSSLLRQEGLLLLLVIAISSLIGMAGTGWVVDKLFHIERQWRAAKIAQGAST